MSASALRDMPVSTMRSHAVSHVVLKSMCLLRDSVWTLAAPAQGSFFGSAERYTPLAPCAQADTLCQSYAESSPESCAYYISNLRRTEVGPLRMTQEVP